MFFLETRPLGDGTVIFFTIVVIIAIFFVISLLIVRFKKEQERYRDETAAYIEGILSKSEMIADINTYIARTSGTLEFGLIYLDLDKFMEIVNAFGKNEADKVLERVASRLLDVVPKRVTISRQKADEFIIFVKSGYTREDCMDIAERLLEVVREPINLYADSFIKLTASASVCFYPMHGNNLNKLLKSLEMAIYVCKREGGNKVNLFSFEETEKEGENLQYYHQIKNAIKNKEFTLYYQPIIDVDNNTLYGAEALLRWIHPEHGMLSPYKFINIMEQSGDISWVGLWGLEALIKQSMQLSKRYTKTQAILSLNLSPKQLTNENLALDFQKLIKKYRWSTDKITLEIAEFALFEKHNIVKDNILKLSDLGFKIAVDGFGLDYAALTKLQALPIDIVKLDGDFLANDSSVVQTRLADMLVDFGRTTAKTIILEGLETKEMLEATKGLGIHYAQGYYFSKPMSEDEFEEYVKNESWKEKK